MTIGELARAGDVPVSTLRYYERVGLLRPSGRSRANYRVYADAELERLRFIRVAQATGFTLADIRELLRATPCRRVQERIEGRLADVRARMAELRRAQRVLRDALERCRGDEATGRCAARDSLTGAAVGLSGRGQGGGPG